MAELSIQYVWQRNYVNNRVIPLHEHSFYEFVYYLNASGEAVIENETFLFKSGSFCIIPPGKKHSETHKGLSKVLVIGFSIDADEELSFFSEEEKPFVLENAEKIVNENKQKKDFYIDMISAYLNEIIIYIKRKLKNYSFATNSTIDMSISYIDEYYLTDIDFENVAKKCGYCLDRYRIIFKQKVGITPKQYILQKKLILAKQMILETNKTLDQISFELGFLYYSRFSMFFKEKVGISPAEYRQLHKK